MNYKKDFSIKSKTCSNLTRKIKIPKSLKAGCTQVLVPAYHWQINTAESKKQLVIYSVS